MSAAVEPQCDYCEGNGYVDCWGCGGDGYVESTEWEDAEEVCSVCSGAGGWPCQIHGGD